MKIRKYNIESYEWVKIPTDLPRENLVMITAKTIAPTIHAEDAEYPIRIFSPKELHEAARSLAKRLVGLNHIRLSNGTPLFIEFSAQEQLTLGKYAFTVDANYNPETRCVEALLCLPKVWVAKIRRNEVKKVSVEYTWRDERKTESGVEFIGLIFDKVDLLNDLPIGVKAGDPNTELRCVETSTLHLFEGEISVPKCKGCKGDGDCEKCVEEPVESNEGTSMNTENKLVESTGTKPEDKKPKGVEAVPPVAPEPIVPPLPSTPTPTIEPPIGLNAVNTTVTPQNTTVVPPVVAPVAPSVVTPPVTIAAETQRLIESQAKSIQDKDAALVKLQESVKTKDTEKAVAVAKAIEKTKADIISKVEAVLPDPTIISRFNKGGQRLAEEIRKVVYEEKKKD